MLSSNWSVSSTVNVTSFSFVAVFAVLSMAECFKIYITKLTYCDVCIECKRGPYRILPFTEIYIFHNNYILIIIRKNFPSWSLFTDDIDRTRLAPYLVQHGNWSWWNYHPPICIRGEWNWPISCVNESRIQKRGLWEVKNHKLAPEIGACFGKSLTICPSPRP